MPARLKWSLAVAFVLLAAADLGVLLMTVINSAMQPVIQCAPAQPASKPPAALVTAADYLAQGDYEFDRGDCARAIAAYSRAIELNPGYAEAYNNRAYAYMTQPDYARALTDLDRAIALRPAYVNALMNRGDIHNYYYDIDYDLAIADYDRVLALGAPHTSVCGHRLLAVNHGWNSGTFVDIFVRGGAANCEQPSPGF
jgi:tetratricopeptide (TPR) repeat protein